MSRTSSQRGLTLVEVILAIAILSIGLSGLVTAASRCLAVARKARTYEQARRLIGAMELEFPVDDPDEIEAGTSESGQFDSPFQHYRWVRSVEQEGPEEDGLFRITMRVYWAERGKQNHEEVVTLLYLPEAVEGGTFDSQ